MNANVGLEETESELGSKILKLNQTIEEKNEKINELTNSVDSIRKELAQRADLMVELKLTKMKVYEKDSQIAEMNETIGNLQKKILSLMQVNDKPSRFPCLELLDLPNRVNSLISNLNENPNRIGYTQNEWIRLILWKHESIQIVAETSPNPVPITSRSAIEVVAEQFATVDELGYSISKCLWESIRYFRDVLNKDPLRMADCINIIMNFKNEAGTEDEKVVKSAMIQLHCAGEDGLLKFDNMIQRFYNEFSYGITDLCSEIWECEVHNDPNYNSGYLFKLLCSSKQKIGDYFPDIFREEVMDQLNSLIVRSLRNEIDNIKHTCNRMEIYKLLNISQWIDNSIADANIFGSAFLMTELLKLESIVTSTYTVKIQDEINVISEKLCKTNYTPKTANEGYLYTEAVTKIFGSISTKIEEYVKYVRGIRLLDVLQLCLYAIQTRQQYQLEEVKAILYSNLRSLPPGYLNDVCAIVNDNINFQMKLVQLHLEYENLLRSKEMDELKHFINTTSTEFEKISSDAMQCASFIIFRDLNDFLVCLFTDRWVCGSIAPVMTALATFDDYFIDIQNWLMSNTSFKTVKYACIERLVITYVERLLSDEVIFKKEDMKPVSNAIFKDYIAMKSYVLQDSSSEEEDTNLSCISVVETLSRYFASSDPSIVFGELAQELGNETGEALYRLLHKRSDLSTQVLETLLVDMEEWKTWATHHGCQNTRFRVYKDTESQQSAKIKKAQKFLEKRIAKAKNSSFMKGVHNAAVRGQSRLQEAASIGHSKLHEATFRHPSFFNRRPSSAE